MTRRSRAGRSALVILAAAASAAGPAIGGCSSPTRPGGIPSGPPLQDSGSTIPPFDGSSRKDTGVVAPSDAKSDALLGTLPTVDEPDTPCTPFNGTRTTLFTADAGMNGFGPPYAGVLSTLGANRFAAAQNQQGFFTFPPAGGSPTFFPAPLGPICSFASEGANVGGAAGGDTIVYQRYSANGTTSTDPVSLSPSYSTLPDGVWIGSGGGESIVVWQAQGNLYGTGITTSGTAASAPWILQAGVLGPSVVIAYDGTRFGIAWSVTPTTSTSQGYFTLADTAGPIGSHVPLASGGTSFSVWGLTPTPTGFAVLAQGSGGDNHTYVLPLDSNGTPVPPAHRLLGADQPWSIAALGSQLGVVVSGDDVGDGETGNRPPLFRPLDATGAALGSWVCLDTPVPSGQPQSMAIAADTSGFSVVYQSAASETVLARFNALGTGGP